MAPALTTQQPPLDFRLGYLTSKVSVHYFQAAAHIISRVFELGAFPSGAYLLPMVSKVQIVWHIYEKNQ